MKRFLSSPLVARLLGVRVSTALLLVATSTAAYGGMIGTPPVYVLPGPVYVLPQPVVPLHPYPVPAHRSLRPVAPPAILIVPPQLPWVAPHTTQPHAAQPYGYPPYPRGYRRSGADHHR